MYVNFYRRFYGKVGACANGVYQALSPPSPQGPGDEAMAAQASQSEVPGLKHNLPLCITGQPLFPASQERKALVS